MMNAIISVQNIYGYLGGFDKRCNYNEIYIHIMCVLKI